MICACMADLPYQLNNTTMPRIIWIIHDQILLDSEIYDTDSCVFN